MSRMLSSNELKESNDAAVFMARIEDRCGRPIGREEVHGIAYTIYEQIDAPMVWIAVEGHVRVPVDKRKTFFDTLKETPCWTIDRKGYNFCHRLEKSVRDAVFQSKQTYRVHYDFLSKSGLRLTLRFQVRALERCL